MESYILNEIKEIDRLKKLYLDDKISHKELNDELHKIVIDYYNFITMQKRSE